MPKMKEVRVWTKDSGPFTHHAVSATVIEGVLCVASNVESFYPLVNVVRWTVQAA